MLDSLKPIVSASPACTQRPGQEPEAASYDTMMCLQVQNAFAVKYHVESSDRPSLDTFRPAITLPPSTLDREKQTLLPSQSTVWTRGESTPYFA